MSGRRRILDIPETKRREDRDIRVSRYQHTAQCGTAVFTALPVLPVFADNFQ
jgi:hypothetical protein